MSLVQGPTPRQTVAAWIQADQLDWTVRDYPWKPKQVAKDQAAVSVWRSDVEPVSNLELQHALTVHLYVSRTEGAAAEQEADDRLDELLLALQKLPGASWSKAERMVFENVFTGWTVQVNLKSTNVYRQAVLAGGA